MAGQSYLDGHVCHVDHGTVSPRAALEAARRRAIDEQWAAADRAKAEAAEQRAYGDGSAAVVSAALDGRQLATAVALLTRPLPVIDRRSVPAVRADLVLWARGLHERDPDEPLAGVLTAALEADPTPADVPHTDEPLPPPPALPSGVTPVELSSRIAALLAPGREQAPTPDAGLSL